MYGVQIAFRDYQADAGFLHSPWVGLAHFQRFFNSHQFWDLLSNTIWLALFNLLVVFPVPIVLALIVNQLRLGRFRRFAQTVLYAPNFISTVVIVGMLYVFLAPRSGLVNNLIVFMGGDPIFFMAESEWFRPVYVGSSLWQEAGFSMVIYLAALAAIDPSLHEAAKMDGATRWQRIRHVDLPGISSTISVLFILSIGNLLNIGFEKALLMQTPLNKDTSQIIQTYVYEVGLLQAQFSFSAAVGLFNSLINMTLLLVFNHVARRARQASLF
ncbi:ABC transporter permease subunit [Phytoactinopolyspora sp. XMNu-373]|uniref:ABC transporter permease subunit n=2 Tax=Phytoactinopolyspora mesophila TaxID=2650750 RepID=A0A7K3M964_9ACTN|nr:ABC transporter permease subunit [Phytoactinopolyspora mesophila]NDL59876.1 ABC transporter permease subunit [Phytoactinopolyspora mesophila]